MFGPEGSTGGRYSGEPQQGYRFSPSKRAADRYKTQAQLFVDSDVCRRDGEVRWDTLRKKFNVCGREREDLICVDEG